MPAPTEPKLTAAWDSARHGSDGWPQFLSGVQIEGLRGWNGELVEFRYPVVAIAGVNGAGKSTILKAAAAAYQAPLNGTAATYYPDDFFPVTPWENVAGVSLSYNIRLGDQSKTVNVRCLSSTTRQHSDRLWTHRPGSDQPRHRRAVDG